MSLATLAALRDYPTLGVRIRIAGAAIARRTPFVFVGNNEYILESYGVGPGGRDRLSLIVTHDTGRAALRAFAGRRPRPLGMDVSTLTSAVTETRRPALLVELDGELATLEPP